MELTFEQLPKAVSQLLEKLEHIESLLLSKSPNLPQDIDHLLTIQQASEFAHLSVPTFYGLVSRNEVPFMKKGKRLYFSKTELLNWIKTGRKKTASEIAADSKIYMTRQKK